MKRKICRFRVFLSVLFWGAPAKKELRFFVPDPLNHLPLFAACTPTTPINRQTNNSMAFFGLTALGAQDPLDVSTDAVQHLHVFKDADWEEAFRRQLRKHKKKKRSEVGSVATDSAEAALSVECLTATMENVYHGPVAPADQRLLEKWLLPSSEDGTITLSAFLTAVQGARTEAEAMVAGRRFGAGPSCESRSWQEYSTNLRKCKAGLRAPSEKQTMPLTATQEIGWETPSFLPAQERKAIRSSEETKYASEMIKAGHFLF
jgi:hypothetical protein